MPTEDRDLSPQVSRLWAYVPLVLGLLLATVYALLALLVLVIEAQWVALTALPFAYWVGRSCIVRIRRLASGS